MMRCITTASYSGLINDQPHGHITPTRGLCQGDPLSPYFFLMCTEGLHGLISKATHNGDIRGVSLCRNGPRITHLLFAYDNLLFCRVREEECQSLLLKCWPSIREPLDSKSTVLRPLFSLVNRPMKTLKQQFKICCVLILFRIMRNILDTLHLWVVKKRKVSPISSSKCGRVSYSVKQVGRY